MPGVHRISDLRSQHGDANETECLTGSPNVFCNGLAVQRAIVDLFEVHGSSPSHTGYVDPGSTTVFVNGRQVARVGDPVVAQDPDICSSLCIGPGSLNVIVGG